MLNFTDPSKKENYFLSQPHQPFFIFGIFWTVIVMLVFGVSYKLIFKGTDILTITPYSFHAYSMIYIVITQFFIGFLYTTFPRFCQSEVITKPYYLATLGLYQLGALVFTIGAFINETIVITGMIILFMAMFHFSYKLLNIYRDSRVELKQDQFWILVALSFGLSMNFYSIIESIFSLPIYSYAISFTLYLTFLTFSVAQRMVPFFSHSFAEKSRYFLATVFTLLVLKEVATIASLSYATIAIDITLATILMKEFLRWELNFKRAPAILKILHVGIFWFPISLYLGSAIAIAELFTQNSFLFAQTHLIALGFIITMVIGFGTRVTLGHSGQPPHADSTALKIFYLTQIVVVARFALSLGFDSGLFWLFDVTLALWSALFIFWSLKFAPTLIFGAKKK